MEKPELTYEQIQDRLNQLYQNLICPICGMPKIHYRLYGYRCSNPEHNERAVRLEAEQIRSDKKR